MDHLPCDRVFIYIVLNFQCKTHLVTLHGVKDIWIQEKWQKYWKYNFSIGTVMLDFIMFQDFVGCHWLVSWNTTPDKIQQTSNQIVLSTINTNNSYILHIKDL